MTVNPPNSSSQRPIRKILIANRGEIACRVIRTCRKLGLSTVAIYSESDRDSLFVLQADEAVFIGPSAANESYLRADRVIAAATSTGADAIHPGYGFLSENADFAKACSQNNLIFIGPRPESIMAIGDKISAKRFLTKHAPSVPLIPGYNGDDQSVETLKEACLRIGFPVLLKASAGGGGRGMRIVRESSKLEAEIEAAKGEALRSFGSDRLLIEKYFAASKHIEVQIFGDQHGNVYHCFERECSVQRRHQKIIEETPSPALSADLRQQMTQAAVTIGKMLKYENAGTVEFLFDTETKRFYFLEVNTRLQVEHPITEAITGLDLVELQILVAQGFSLASTSVPQLKSRGHAIESRLCAEDPVNNFLPCTGKIILWNEAPRNHLGYPRYDTGVGTDSQISVYYDSMIAKITVWAPTRQEAISAMEVALRNTTCLGLMTNKRFLVSVFSQPEFLLGQYTTRLIESMFHDQSLVGSYKALEQVSVTGMCVESPSMITPYSPVIGSQTTSFELDIVSELSVMTVVWLWHQNVARQKFLRGIPSGWRALRYRPSKEVIVYEGKECLVEYLSDVNPKSAPVKLYMKTETTGWFSVELESPANIDFHLSRGFMRCTIDTHRRTYFIARALTTGDDAAPLYYISRPGLDRQYVLKRKNPRYTSSGDAADAESAYTSTMPCRILKLLVKEGSVVKEGDALINLESMKMEIRMCSRHSGKVKFNVKEGQVVEAGVDLLEVK